MRHMKRIVLFIILMAMLWQASAQRPVIPAGTGEYMCMPPATQDSVSIYPPDAYFGRLGGYRVGTDFIGDAYRSPKNGVTVYGVATEDGLTNKYPYLWVYVLQDRLVDTVNNCYAQDTVASELFCFVGQTAVSYADFAYEQRAPWYSGLHGVEGLDTIDIPFYEFYFTDPVFMPEGVRFYVGVSHSPFNEYNHVIEGRINYPVLLSDCPIFLSHKRGGSNPSQVSGCPWDGLDSVWRLWKGHLNGLTDWMCDRCHIPFPNPEMEANYAYLKYRAHGFSPIIQPPTDSARIFPPHDHPLRAEGVHNFRLTELDSAHASFAWDTFPPSDWGPVGVNVNAYQVNYAPYMQEYDEGDTLVRMATSDSCTLYMPFDSTVMYKARCRARSRHRCDIHDTVVWGEWSEEVYFHTGVEVPDTVPLECLRVEGLRYEGLVGGNPRVSWEHCEGHDYYEVQYAPEGGAWQRAPVTSMTTCVLYAGWVPGTRYVVRVRAKCRHQCHIHDTLMVSEWSDTVGFTMPGEAGVEAAGEAEGKELFVVAPNPTKGSVVVSPTELAEGYPAVLTVNDAKGREVLRHTLTDGSPLALELGALPSGTYLVTLTTRTRQTGTKRLVVEN